MRTWMQLRTIASRSASRISEGENLTADDIWPRLLNAESPVKFVNTSMHGVGHPFVVRAFEAYGLPPFIPVKEQQDPDPDFPTVKVWVLFEIHAEQC